MGLFGALCFKVNPRLKLLQDSGWGARDMMGPQQSSFSLLVASGTQAHTPDPTH